MSPRHAVSALSEELLLPARLHQFLRANDWKEEPWLPESRLLAWLEALVYAGADHERRETRVEEAHETLRASVRDPAAARAWRSVVALLGKAHRRVHRPRGFAGDVLIPELADLDVKLLTGFEWLVRQPWHAMPASSADATWPDSSPWAQLWHGARLPWSPWCSAWARMCIYSPVHQDVVRWLTWLGGCLEERVRVPTDLQPDDASLLLDAVAWLGRTDHQASEQTEGHGGGPTPLAWLRQRLLTEPRLRHMVEGLVPTSPLLTSLLRDEPPAPAVLTWIDQHWGEAPVGQEVGLGQVFAQTLLAAGTAPTTMRSAVRRLLAQEERAGRMDALRTLGQGVAARDHGNLRP